MADYSNFKENELLKVESKFIHKDINHVEIYFARFVSQESVNGDAIVTTSVKIKQICNFKESLTKGEDEILIDKHFDFHDLNGTTLTRYKTKR